MQYLFQKKFKISREIRANTNNFSNFEESYWYYSRAFPLLLWMLNFSNTQISPVLL